MDEEQGKELIIKIWQQAKATQGVTMNKAKFINLHMQSIRRINKGYWVMPDAKKYLINLQDLDRL